MKLSEYVRYDALGLAELVSRNEVSPSELLRTAISAIEQLNPTLNAITQKLYDHAEQALRQGLPQGPFTGVPFLLKDAGILLTGTPNYNGSRWFDDMPADHDSTLTLRYKQAGLVIMGKTSTPELGLSVTTEPLRFGPTRNPWNPAHSTGGSSGGAAAAVASGMLPAAHASDGAGSIRIPASCCGLFGLKPSRGRLPVGPDRGEVWSGLAVAHALTRSVRDSAALLDATAGPEPGDPYACPESAGRYSVQIRRAPERLRIACTTGDIPQLHADCRRAYEEAVRLCLDLGHTLEEAAPALDAVELTDALLNIAAAGVAAGIDEYCRLRGRSHQAGDFEAVTEVMLQRAAERPIKDYVSALNAIHRAGRITGQFHENYDLLLTPTLALPPPPLGVLRDNGTNTYLQLRRIFEFTPYTPIANMTGQPSMTLPIHWNEAGLPIGVMFTAGLGREDVLLRLAAQIEQARPWTGRLPPVHAGQLN